MSVWDAEVAVSTPSRVGESPWWEGDRLVWVDIPAGLINARAGETTEVTELGEPVGFILGRRGGGYVAGTASGLIGLDARLRPTGWTAVPPDLDERRRINDGVCDPEGRVLFGTVDPSGAAPGTLWSMSPDGVFTALVDGVGMSNGIAFSPDARRLYYVDSLTRRIDSFRYEVATGAASDRRCLCRVQDGLPDGLAVDAQGGIWVAVWGPGEIRRLTPAGDRIGAVRVGAARTTSCAFAGDSLYITTARDGASDLDSRDRDRHPGAVFVAEIGIGGAKVWSAAEHG
jgi:sugar lactone lactonase YvrE